MCVSKLNTSLAERMPSLRLPKMHKNSSQQSRKLRLLCSNITIFVFLLVSGITKINAVPTDSTGAAARSLLLHRALRDVASMMSAGLVQEAPKDVVATSTESTFDQPQGQCLLDGVLVAETSVTCEKQLTNCRAIQKTGHCCPDYKCDCEKDGKTYLNGDKLVDPETPCTVCYCQGGEILCSSAVCFHRDDCTPRYIPGRCCPEYDNCPVTNRTVVSSTPSPRPDMPPVAPLNSNITIKEITKPTEIRITDENKAKPIHLLKTSTTTTTTTTTPTPESSTTAYSSTTPATLILLRVPDDVLLTDDVSNVTNLEDLEEPLAPLGINVNRADNPISQELQRVEHESANGSSKVNIKREFMFATTEGSLNISSAEALGGDLDSSELIYTNIEAEPSDSNESLLQTAAADSDPETAGSDNIYHIILSTDGPGVILSSSTEGASVPKLTGSTEGINFETSSVTITIIKSTEGVDSIPQSTTDGPNKALETTTDGLDAVRPTETTTDSSSTETIKSTTQHYTEDDENAVIMESNPAYPVLPEDDFSIRDVNPPLTEVDDTAEADVKDESRGYIDNLKSTKLLEENGLLESGSGNGLDQDMVNSTEDTNGSSTTESVKATMLPEKIQFMYSLEEELSSAETTISNGTDFQIGKIMREIGENDTGSGGDLLEMEAFVGNEFGSGNGSGSGELLGNQSTSSKDKEKFREPTTPKPTHTPPTEVDIDELSDASGDGKAAPVEDPKLDAESLKLDEKQNDGVAETDAAAAKNNILAVKVNPAEDKTINELQPSPLDTANN